MKKSLQFSLVVALCIGIVACSHEKKTDNTPLLGLLLLSQSSAQSTTFTETITTVAATATSLPISSFSYPACTITSSNTAIPAGTIYFHGGKARVTVTANQRLVITHNASNVTATVYKGTYTPTTGSTSFNSNWCNATPTTTTTTNTVAVSGTDYTSATTNSTTTTITFLVAGTYHVGVNGTFTSTTTLSALVQ